MITKKRNAEKSNAFGSEHGVFRAGRKEYCAVTSNFFVLGLVAMIISHTLWLQR